MSAGKQIVSTYCIDNDSSLPYLKKYPNVLLLDERCRDLDSQVEKRENFIANCEIEPVNVQDLYERYEKNTPAAFVNLLRDDRKTRDKV